MTYEEFKELGGYQRYRNKYQNLEERLIESLIETSGNSKLYTYKQTQGIFVECFEKMKKRKKGSYNYYDFVDVITDNLYF